ncbi:hypothetical protein JHK82_030960 [Glycine max]|uniref:RNase H type-1 domain-containing protein n=1 Tax=Glycine max TaxID=3847 RepID=A0A0R0HQ15_SOYBN|nr:hypothetical protein JHK85_031605 [Glycine max]KAG5124223.1 hypothetical protein JHK82_030960 [Glycine max]KAG5145643.1 hypothetical protein JHK84_031186 [Glycine max]
MAYLQKEKPPEHKQQPQKTYQQYPSYQSALHLRLIKQYQTMVVVLAIERAIFYNWKHFWLETDSTLVLHAFSHPKSVHWSIYNRWMNCINHINHINFRISHIYREGNVCVAKLASFGAQSSGYTWWDSPPSFVVQQFLKYRQELPFYRFS